MPYYAVRKGRKPGIYETWTECEAQVKKFTGAQFKKFSTQSEAQAFIDFSSTSYETAEPAATVGRKRSLEAKDEEGSSGAAVSSSSDTSSAKRQRTSTEAESQFVVVYTDGACTNNGYHTALGGIGVYWGPNDRRNVSDPLPPGRQTNNRAEILACARAIEQAMESGVNRLEIRTDSQFTITCMTTYLPKWLKNGWRTANGKPVLNQEELVVLQDQKLKFEKSGGRLKFTHVSGHSGEVGNEAADRLAVEGSRKRSN